MVLIARAVTNLPDAVVIVVDVVFGFDADVAFIAALELPALTSNRRTWTWRGTDCRSRNKSARRGRRLRL